MSAHVAQELSLSVTIDLEAWMTAYGQTEAEARADVRTHLTATVQHAVTEGLARLEWFTSAETQPAPPALDTSAHDAAIITQLIGDHVQDKATRERLLDYHSLNDRMAGAALSFICSIDGEDAGSSEDLNEMRELAVENGGDVGASHCSLDAETCDHQEAHEHAA